MRPVDKGVSQRIYKVQGDARDDLIDQIGDYCSFCEMALAHMIEVDHVVPHNQGGAMEWENFLLSCKYCNTVKNDRNTSRDNYIWPDLDNSDLAFQYTEYLVVYPAEASNNVMEAAERTIALYGLDRKPGGRSEPTIKDRRWLKRIEVWNIARQSLGNWEILPIQEMAEQIALTAKGYGFYSIWKTVFGNEPQVLNAIEAVFPNTYRRYENGVKEQRQNALI